MFTKFLLFFSTIFLVNLHAAETDTYDFSWLDPDKEVFVLQNRKYRKVQKIHLNVGYGITTSGAFVDATTIQGRFGYFFTENYGFEVLYAKNSGNENTTAESVRFEGRAIPFRRIVDGYMGAMFLWSPFYSKINTFNKIIYMDWIFGFGYAKLDETNNLDAFIADNKNLSEKKSSHSGVMWDIGAKFYLNESWSIKLDLTTVHYQAIKADGSGQDGWFSNYDLTAAFGYNF